MKSQGSDSLYPTVYPNQPRTHGWSWKSCHPPLKCPHWAPPAHPPLCRLLSVPHTLRWGLEGAHGCTYQAAGIANAPEAGTDVIPDTDAAPADPLPHRQLQEEQGEPNDDE